MKFGAQRSIFQAEPYPIDLLILFVNGRTRTFGRLGVFMPDDDRRIVI